MKFNLETIKERLGGEWYDIWWCAIDERFNSCNGFLGMPDFWGEINSGWLEMYYEPPTDEELREKFLKSICINSIPYYNEKYYL